MGLEWGLLLVVLGGDPSGKAGVVEFTPAVPVPVMPVPVLMVPPLPAMPFPGAVPIVADDHPRWNLPFTAVPQSQLLTDRSADSDAAEASDNGKFQYVVFREPASFEIIPSFPDGIQTSTDTAVIYEGMALRYETHGNYQVRMILEAPATTVTLRLQFVVYEHHRKRERNERLGTITLPPITLEGVSNVNGDGRPRLWRLQHSGYSPHLDTGDCPECQQRKCHCQRNSFAFTRVGTAEFGQIPQR